MTRDAGSETGGAASAKRPPRRKPRIPFYWWPFWMFLLFVGIVFFYGILTPVWMAIRLVAWLSERSARRLRSSTGGAEAAPDRR